MKTKLSKESQKFIELIYNPDITEGEIEKLFDKLLKIQQRQEIRIRIYMNLEQRGLRNAIQ